MSYNPLRKKNVEIEQDTTEKPFLCCLTYARIGEADCVLLEDGYTYHRKALEIWLNQCPNRSPVTGLELQEQPGVPDLQRHSISAFRAPENLSHLGDVLKAVDPLRPLLESLASNWQPPQLIVCGAEGVGKSSLLERLVGVPLFPRRPPDTNARTCTQVPIRVQLRRRPYASIPCVQLLMRTGDSSWALQKEELAACEGAHIVVGQLMKEAIAETSKQKGYEVAVSGDYLISVLWYSPNVPDLDLLDLPGLVGAVRKEDPRGIVEETRAVVEAEIFNGAWYSIYLAVVEASEAIYNSPVIHFLQKSNLDHQTIGVITKCDEEVVCKDEYPPRSVSSHSVKVAHKIEKADSVLLGGGFLGTMSRDQEPQPLEWSIQRLHRKAEAEVEWRRSQELENSASVGCTAVLKRVQNFYLSYISDTWCPLTREILAITKVSLTEELKSLGTPAPESNCWEHILSSAKAVLSKMLPRLRRDLEVKVIGGLQSAFSGLIPKLVPTVYSTASEVVTAFETARADLEYRIRTAAGKAIDALGAYSLICEVVTGDESPLRLRRFPLLSDGLANEIIQRYTVAHQELLKELEVKLQGLLACYEFTTPPFTPEYQLNLDTLRLSSELQAIISFGVMSLCRSVLRPLSEIVASLSQRVIEIENCSEERQALSSHIGNIDTALASLASLKVLSEAEAGNTAASRVQRVKQWVVAENFPGRHKPWFRRHAAADKQVVPNNCTLRVLIVGAGPAGLTVAINLAELLSKKAQITLADSRIKFDSERVVSGARTRRDQVVTLQWDVLQFLSPVTRSMLLSKVNEAVWSISSRNIPISLVEDSLLERAQQWDVKDSISFQPIPKLERPEDILHLQSLLTNSDIVIAADGANSWTREHIFGITKEQLEEPKEQNGRPRVDRALGVAFIIPKGGDFPAGLPFEQSINVISTLSQRRFLLNASSPRRSGYVNILLSNDEWKLVKTVDGNRCRFGINPGFIRPHGPSSSIRTNPDVHLPDHSLKEFAPAKDAREDPSGPGAKLWQTVLDGLSMFGLQLSYVTNIVGIKLRVRSTRTALKYGLRDQPDTIGFLVGDAAFQTHFWPGRGMNSVLKEANLLAYCIASQVSATGGIRSGDLEFQVYEGFMAALRNREHRDRSERFLCGSGLIQVVHKADQDHRTKPEVVNVLCERILDQSRRVQRMGPRNWPHRTLKEDQLRCHAQQTLEKLSLRELLIMLTTGPWPAAPGNEVLPEEYTPIIERANCRWFFRAYASSTERTQFNHRFSDPNYNYNKSKRERGRSGGRFPLLFLPLIRSSFSPPCFYDNNFFFFFFLFDHC
jgi:flavin-dependent dehydrogenase